MCRTRADRLAVALLVALVALWVSPFFTRIAVPPFQARGAFPLADLETDAQNHYTHLLLDRMGVVRFGQFPWRTHLVGGGLYLFAHPRDVTLSPVFLPVLLLGEALGLKVYIAAVYFAAALGMYYLCRVCLGLGPIGSFYAGALLVAAAWLPERMVWGSFDEWHFVLFPLILAFFKRARRNRRYAIGAAMLLYVVLYDGKYIFAILCLYLALFAAGEVLERLWRRVREQRLRHAGRAGPEQPAAEPGWWEPIPRLAGIVLLVVLLGMVKILPMLSILKVDDRTRRERYERPFVSWAWPMVPARVVRYLDLAVVSVPPPLWRVRFVGAGPWALLLALVAFLRHPGRLGGWMLLFALSVWLALWRQMPVDLFRPLSHLPVFRSIKQPLRFFNWPVLFCLCVMGGRLVSTIAGERRRFWPTLAALALVFAALFPLLDAHFTIQAHVFSQRAPRLAPPSNFYPVVAIDPTRKQYRQWRDYRYVKQNIGVINWYCPLDLPRAAEPMFYVDRVGRTSLNPDYRGEAFFLQPANRARVLELTPNRIRVAVRLSRPDTLVVNQNHDPRWRTDRGAVTSMHMDTPAYLLVGLDDRWASPVKYDRTRREFRRLAVRLDEPGSYVLTLRYRPWDAYLGAMLSGPAWLVSIVLLLGGVRRRRRGSSDRTDRTHAADGERKEVNP